MEGARSSSMSPYQLYDFRARQTLVGKAHVPRPWEFAFGSAPIKGAELIKILPVTLIGICPLGCFAAPILDSGGVLLLPSADCDPIREQQGGFVSTPHSSRSLRSTPEILQFLKGLQVTKENLRARTTSAPPTFQSALSRPLSLCSLMRFGHDRGHRG